jgi:succinylarginine dihydrolase
MWTANAATVSPSADTRDGRVHFTPANLLSQFHRSLETAATAPILQRIFTDEAHFVHHPPLPAAWPLADEGAANHMRLSAAHGQSGVEVFTFGRTGLTADARAPRRFPARQTLEASQTIARSHGLDDSALFLRQSPLAIDAGAFHNDVVAVANLNVLLFHQHAWENSASVISNLRRTLRERGANLVVIEVKATQVSLADAVRSYLFNSQLVSLPDGSMALVAPLECRRIPSARRFLDTLPDAGTPVKSVHYLPIRQSMRNGGGPACLRLRVVLTERELAAAHQGVFLTAALHAKLTAWINRHYRDSLSPADLADPQLLKESRRALDELTGILGLGLIYDFQLPAQTRSRPASLA